MSSEVRPQPKLSDGLLLIPTFRFCGVAVHCSAADLSCQIGSYHVDLSMDTVVEAVVALFSLAVSGGVRPRFKAHGGTIAENLALQAGLYTVAVVCASAQPIESFR